MIAALFYIDGWMGHEEYLFKGENPHELLMQFNNVQDLECLSRMAKNQGTDEDRKEITVLDELLSKDHCGKLTLDDLASFSIEISIGKIGVTDVASSEDSIELLNSRCNCS